MAIMGVDPQLEECVQGMRWVCAGATGKILGHAEGEDGAVSVVMLFERRGEIVLRFPDRGLTDAFFAHWNASLGDPWSELFILVAGKNVSVERKAGTAEAAMQIESRIPVLAKTYFGASAWNDTETESVPAKRPWWRLF